MGFVIVWNKIIQQTVIVNYRSASDPTKFQLSFIEISLKISRRTASEAS